MVVGHFQADEQHFRALVAAKVHRHIEGHLRLAVRGFPRQHPILSLHQFGKLVKGGEAGLENPHLRQALNLVHVEELADGLCLPHRPHALNEGFDGKRVGVLLLAFQHTY